MQSVKEVAAVVPELFWWKVRSFLLPFSGLTDALYSMRRLAMGLRRLRARETTLSPMRLRTSSRAGRSRVLSSGSER